MQKIITLLLTFLSVLPLWAQVEYYVDPINGNDINSGISQEHSWKTIQKACNAATPNSVVLIRQGVYHENITINVSGTPGNEIIFRNYENESVIIDGTGTSGTFLLNISDKSHLKFENLVLRNLTGNHAAGVIVETYSQPVANLEFKNLTIYNIKWTDNPEAIPGEGNNAHGIVVNGSTDGITGLAISGCKIYNNITGRSEALSVCGNVDGFLIEDCDVFDNTNIGIDVSGNYGISDDPLTDQPRNGLIRGNTCHGNISPYAVSAGIYADGAKNITIEKNKCYGNGLGIEVGCEENGSARYITVKNNLIYGNLKNGLSVGGYTTATTGEVLYCTFRNNTFFQNNALDMHEGEITLTKASYCVFEDNLVYTNSQNILISVANIQPQAGNLINYNSWYTPSGNPDNINIYWGAASYHTFDGYTEMTGQDGNSLYGNPGFEENIQPQLYISAGGNCVDAGNPELDISPDETDFDGNPRIVNGTIDIGARELQTSLGLQSPINSPILVYPNPFRTSAQLILPFEMQSATLQLFDLSGRKVAETENLSGRQMAIHRNQLANGIYIYTICDKNQQVATGKIIVE